MAIPFVELAVDDLAVDGHVEDAPAALDQACLDTERFLQFGSQTGCPGKVVSDPAIGDRDVHVCNSSVGVPGRERRT
jgi:hypothetical protein